MDFWVITCLSGGIEGGGGVRDLKISLPIREDH